MVDPIPSSLLPACATMDAVSDGDVARISVAGRSLTILEDWISDAGKEKSDPLDEETGDFRGSRCTGRQKKRKGEAMSPRKTPAPKRGKKVPPILEKYFLENVSFLISFFFRFHTLLFWNRAL